MLKYRNNLDWESFFNSVNTGTDPDFIHKSTQIEFIIVVLLYCIFIEYQNLCELFLSSETQEVDQGPKEEPEPQEMTLDEWKALQAQKKTVKNEFNIRQAGEGVDGKQWQKGIEYHKKHDEEDDEEEDSEEEDDEVGFLCAY